ncbi:type II toxin-antitoxin system RelE/ParE family toxin [Mycetocola sp. BIGb0189]|uniref:type II toxin-antitoxin system RelE family toxin n=1 Tax=Mycetocola sp. BIGb0189 TaxID=2940604 RepID=UPI002167E40E|nr:type II toxin-antitoxin system RelE/ParE family toxin [Mycetocola sp. BIGb0189]
MVGWEIELSQRAERSLRKLDRQVARRIRDALVRLAAAQEPWDACKALSGPLTGFWRYRVGDYRIVLDFDRGRFVIIALDLGHRSDIYT